jgi:glycosyltransferase involved in cell wall biosynthesis
VDQKNFLKNLFFQKIEKFLNKRTDQIIFVSQNTKDVFLNKKLLLKKNWQVVYNGIDLEYSQKFLKNKQEIKQRVFEKFNFKKQTRLISFVGRFSFEKNLFALVKVAPELVKEFPDLKFVLVGDGEEKEKLIKKIEKNNLKKYFVFPGFLEKEKVYEIVCASDIFVLPSFYETFSYTVLEALSLGVPVVATKVGGVQELIESGVNGFLVPRDNLLELKEKIKEVLKNSKIKEKFVSQGLKTAQNFSEEKMVQKIKQIYMSLYEQ